MTLFEYVDRVLAYLKSDIDGYDIASEEGIWEGGAGPYLLTASSGIDFLGSMGVPESLVTREQKWLAGKSATGSQWYIREFLAGAREVYAQAGVDVFLYRVLRCGQVHEGIVKPGCLISAHGNPKYHMKLLRFAEVGMHNPKSADVLHVDTAELAHDFLASAEEFRKEMESSEALFERCLTRLNSHLASMKRLLPILDMQPVLVDQTDFRQFFESGSMSPEQACWLTKGWSDQRESPDTPLYRDAESELSTWD